MARNYLLETHNNYNRWRFLYKQGLTDKPYIPKKTEDKIFEKFIEKHKEKIKSLEETV